MPKFYISITADEAAEFLSKSGLLFEINRLVLHPRGLALAVKTNDADEVIGFAGLADYRKEKDGIVFADGTLEEGAKKLRTYDAKTKDTKRRKARVATYGFEEQPLPKAK